MATFKNVSCKISSHIKTENQHTKRQRRGDDGKRNGKNHEDD